LIYSFLNPTKNSYGIQCLEAQHIQHGFAPGDVHLPDEFPTTPVELSFLIASNIYGPASKRQMLLQMQSTAQRLKREAKLLAFARNHLAARTALKEVLD